MKRLSNTLVWFAAVLIGGYVVANVMAWTMTNAGDWHQFVSDLLMLFK